MTTTQLKVIDAKEAVHLFGILNTCGVKCSLEFKVDGVNDPLFGVSDAPISAEYFKGQSSGDSLIVHFGEAEFNFELPACDFFKDVSDSQISICVATDRFSAFFSSGSVPAAGIKEARNYVVSEREFEDEFHDKEIRLDAASEHEFDEGVNSLINLLQEGRVIKKSIVTGDGKQVLTVGYFAGTST